MIKGLNTLNSVQKAVSLFENEIKNINQMKYKVTVTVWIINEWMGNEVT